MAVVAPPVSFCAGVFGWRVPRPGANATAPLEMVSSDVSTAAETQIGHVIARATLLEQCAEEWMIVSHPYEAEPSGCGLLLLGLSFEENGYYLRRVHGAICLPEEFKCYDVWPKSGLGAPQEEHVEGEVEGEIMVKGPSEASAGGVKGRRKTERVKTTNWTFSAHDNGTGSLGFMLDDDRKDRSMIFDQNLPIFTAIKFAKDSRSDLVLDYKITGSFRSPLHNMDKTFWKWFNCDNDPKKRFRIRRPDPTEMKEVSRDEYTQRRGRLKKIVDKQMERLQAH